jgi:hypothetical protein
MRIFILILLCTIISGCSADKRSSPVIAPASRKDRIKMVYELGRYRHERAVIKER